MKCEPGDKFTDSYGVEWTITSIDAPWVNTKNVCSGCDNQTSFRSLEIEMNAGNWKWTHRQPTYKVGDKFRCEDTLYVITRIDLDKIHYTNSVNFTHWSTCRIFEAFIADGTYELLTGQSRETTTNTEPTCTCESRDLAIHGCQCDWADWNHEQLSTKGVRHVRST